MRLWIVLFLERLSCWVPQCLNRRDWIGMLSFDLDRRWRTDAEPWKP